MFLMSDSPASRNQLCMMFMGMSVVRLNVTTFYFIYFFNILGAGGDWK